MTRPEIEITIIGAGISGLALAIGLQRRGIKYTVYEASQSFSAVGLGIGLGPNSVRALALISPELKILYDTIATGNSTLGKENVFCLALLAEDGFGVNQGWTGATVGSKNFTKSGCHRRSLLQVMKTLVPEDRVRFGKRVIDFRQDAEYAYVEFEDGEIIRSKAVVGCDGIKSRAREAVLSEEYSGCVAATYAGRYCYRAVIEMSVARGILGDLAGDGIIFFGESCWILVSPIAHGEQMNMLAGRQNEQLWPYAEWVHGVSREQMLDDFRGRCDARLLSLIEHASPDRWALHHHPVTPTYFKGRICLLGDSAHASTPHQGSGAGQCFEDALMLSHLLSLVKEEAQIGSVFQTYDELMRPRGQKIVQTSYEAGSLYTLSDPRFGKDIRRIVANCNERFIWIWEHDLDKELQKGRVALSSKIISGHGTA